jgi:hypothetical protein
MQIKKLPRSTELFIFSVFFLLTIIAWIAVEIHHIEKNKKFTLEYRTGMNLEIKEAPDLKTLDILKQKK